MKKQISLKEIETLIRKNIQEKGLANKIGENEISEIKKKIKSHLAMPTANIFAMDFDVDDAGGMEESNISEEKDVELPVQTADQAVTHQTIVNDKTNDIAKKEGAIETKEEFLARKEQELMQKEEELKKKEADLKYKPEMPDFILKADPGKIFVFKENELSLGSESLMKMPYHMVDNPEEKKSMHELWLEQGKVRAEVYQVEFKRIGDMVFRPLEGVCKFEAMTSPIPKDIPADDRESVRQAILSQQPKEPMVDSTEPITNVVLPMSNDMGLNTPDIAAVMQGIIEKALKDYFINKTI